MNEIWKDITGFEGLYQVSNLGNVRSITRYKMVLNPSIDKDGYRYVKLKHKGKEKHCRVARLVAMMFIPKIDGKNMVNHIDAIRDNDKAENLEWCTAKENVLHSAKLGNYDGINAKSVKQMNGDVCVKVWDSMTEAANTMKIAVSNICKCALGERKSAGGFQWEYA